MTDSPEAQPAPTTGAVPTTTTVAAEVAKLTDAHFPALGDGGFEAFQPLRAFLLDLAKVL
jgi:hypothetical protein